MKFKNTVKQIMKANGISGRKILATCTSIMMFMGGVPTTNMTISPSYVASAKESANTSITIPNNRYSNLSRKQVLRLEELFALYVFCFMGLLSDSVSKSNYATAFLTTECLKNSAEILEILSGNDYSECKSKLDELLSSTDWETFDEEEFSKKATDICDEYGLSDDVIDALYESSVYDNVDSAYQNLWFKGFAKRSVMKSLKISFAGYKKILYDIFEEQEISDLTDYVVARTDEHLDLLNQ